MAEFIAQEPQEQEPPRKAAFWHYYTNDEGRARWCCSECGKVCKKNPHYKIFCSHCGAHMRMES